MFHVTLITVINFQVF